MIDDDLHYNGPDLSEAHLNSLLLDTFHGFWTKDSFKGKLNAFKMCVYDVRNDC